MRYTEARLTQIAEEMLADIDKDTVDFVPTYDESRQEPVVLPTRHSEPAYQRIERDRSGMATNIPPHNLTEIVTATIELVNNPGTQLKDILKIVKGPDFPTGAYIKTARVESSRRTRMAAADS